MIAAIRIVGWLRLGGLSYSEHFGAAYRANTLGGGFTVLHGNCSRILNLYLLSVFNTVSLHFGYLLLLNIKDKLFNHTMSIA